MSGLRNVCAGQAVAEADDHGVSPLVVPYCQRCGSLRRRARGRSTLVRPRTPTVQLTPESRPGAEIRSRGRHGVADEPTADAIRRRLTACGDGDHSAVLAEEAVADACRLAAERDPGELNSAL